MSTLASTAMITGLTSDALDTIVGHVESRADILNVALSNRALRHLHYCDIRSKLHNPFVVMAFPTK